MIVRGNGNSPLAGELFFKICGLVALQFILSGAYTLMQARFEKKL
jgi:hypothetical protein